MSNDKTSIRLVCFDLGGVVVRICRSWPEGCRAAGIDLRGDFPSGDAQLTAWNELGAQLGSGRIDPHTWSRSISELIQGAYSADEVRNIHSAWILGEYEGVGDIIDQLHDAGLQTAALSNTNSDHWAQMNDYPAFLRLGRRFASHELGLLKPDPAIYRAFERRANQRGNEILFFDDTPENITAAQSLGWRAELIDPHSRTDHQIARALQRHGIELPQRASAVRVRPDLQRRADRIS